MHYLQYTHIYIYIHTLYMDIYVYIYIFLAFDPAQGLSEESLAYDASAQGTP